MQFHSYAIGLVMLTTTYSQVIADAVEAGSEQPRVTAAALLDKALRDTEALTRADQQLALLKSAAKDTLRLVPANVLVSDALRAAEQTSSVDPAAVAKQLRSALAEVRDVLRFEPLMEAPLPEGFPEPTPVGEIRVQKFPEYRLAKTDMTFFEGRAFWTLFNHIKKHDIAMTAPVEMQYSAETDKSLKQSSMAFLYRSTQQGTPGAEDKVEVTDVPAHLAVSIGLRGDATKARVADAKRRLEAWIDVHAAEYEASGPLRVMGYNSPFVSDAQRYTEVQIPVRATSTASER